MAASLFISRRDVDFLLHDWLRVEELCTRERFADHGRETISAALDVYESIASDLFAPHYQTNDVNEPRMEGDVVVTNPPITAALRAFAEAGLLAAGADAALNGMQLPSVVERAGISMMMAANCSTTGYALLTIANANLLQTYGTPAQIDAYVRPMLQGRFFGTMCLSEPQAGSSLADITTRAVPLLDGTYRLFGNKMWISGGDQNISENIVHLVLAKAADANGKLEPGVSGLSLFVVPKLLLDERGHPSERNDVVVAGLNHKMGYRGTTNCLLNFGEGRHRPLGEAGAVGQLVGRLGEGLACMFHMMNEARIGVGIGAAALGYSGYLHALEYARNRPQGRLPTQRGQVTAPQVPIIQHPDVRRMLLMQKAYVEGGLALGLYCSKLVDDSLTAPDASVRQQAKYLLDLLTPVAKSWPSQWCLAANDLAIQVHGGYGYTRDYKVEQLYRDNRLNPIHEGTQGIQALDLLGRKISQNGGAGMRELRLRVVNTTTQAANISELRGFSDRLLAALNRVESVAHSQLAIADPEMRLANASTFMEAFGHVVVAWLWLDQACAASSMGDIESNFRAGKLQACRYFYDWELPKLDGWCTLLGASPNDTCLRMEDAWF